MTGDADPEQFSADPDPTGFFDTDPNSGLNKILIFPVKNNYRYWIPVPAVPMDPC